MRVGNGEMRRACSGRIVVNIAQHNATGSCIIRTPRSMYRAGDSKAARVYGHGRLSAATHKPNRSPTSNSLAAG